MKIKRRPFIQLLLMVGFVFTVITSCNKTDDPGDSENTATVEDASGNVYKTIKIGSQIWMAENLKTTKYNDGTPIPNVTDAVAWGKLSAGAYCNYDNLESNVATYGLLYNWYAVNTGKLAPKGWHVPTNDDWIILENYLIANGYNYDGTKAENKVAKSLCSTNGWTLSSNTGTPGAAPGNNNSSGFTAFPGGGRFSGGTFGNVGEIGLWWSSTEFNFFVDEYSAYCRFLYYNDRNLYKTNNSKECGFSVRLVRD